MTTIGDMRHVLSLQECIRTADEGGGTATHWQDIASHPQVFAALALLEGTLDVEARQLTHAEECRITLRFRPDITPQLRLCDETYSYRILSLRDVDGRQAYLEIRAAREPLQNGNA